MIVTDISLVHFRNFNKATYSFSPNLTLIVGENARGKTSLLEALYASVYGTGFRESREIELVSWDEDGAMVESYFVDKKEKTFYQMRLQKIDETTIKKSFYVNKTEKSAQSYRQLQTQAVLFAPQHIEIITGSPSGRREYFDIVLSSFDYEYKKKLKNYESALRQRNKLLEQHRTEEKLWEEITFWNDYLIEHANYITQKREDYVAYLNKNNMIAGKEFSIIYDKNTFTKADLIRVYELEMRMRKTAIGPQKDDFTIYLHDPIKKNVNLFGSRSEQRMAVFWLKLNELQYFEKATKRKPLLLLDDIFSELDGHNRQLVMDMITDYQTVATTTEEEVKDLAHIPEVIIRL